MIIISLEPSLSINAIASLAVLGGVYRIKFIKISSLAQVWLLIEGSSYSRVGLLVLGGYHVVPLTTTVAQKTGL